MEPLLYDTLACLRQGAELLSRLDDRAMRTTCEKCFESSIGEHLRHNSDHFLAFFQGLPTGRINYDDRPRDSRHEREANAAARLLEDFSREVSKLAGSDLDRPVEIQMDGGSARAWSRSTVRRELQFLISHTIHHYALIAVIVRLENMTTLPAGFGVAPSTLKAQATR